MPIWESASSIDFDVDNQIVGRMKHIYFARGHSEVVSFFHDTSKNNEQSARLEKIINDYNPTLNGQPDAEYWRDLFCWPTAIVDHPKFGIGIVSPIYPKCFFFLKGPLAGNKKEGAWFNNIDHLTGKPFRYSKVDESERGNLKTYLAALGKICRAVSRIHAGGLAHADLSESNVLIDPSTGGAIIIDLDSLFVTGMHPPDVLGSPGYIAPEVLATIHLPFVDILKKTPSPDTNKFSLAVMIYKYLLERHPLEGKRKILGLTAEEDEVQIFGSGAIYSEHRNNNTNRPVDRNYLKASILGKELEDLFHKSFVDGLLDPSKRPLPSEFELALCGAFDMLLPCGNPACTHKYFVLTNKWLPICPYCTTPYFTTKFPTKSPKSFTLLKLSNKGNGQSIKCAEMVLEAGVGGDSGTNIFGFHAFQNAKRGAGQDETILATVVYLPAPNSNPGYYLKNISLPDMQVRNPSAANHDFHPVPLNKYLQLNNGIEILFGNGPNARKGFIETYTFAGNIEKKSRFNWSYHYSNYSRIPCYILVDISRSMAGDRISAVIQALFAFFSTVHGNPNISQQLWVSIITFNETATQLNPLTPFLRFDSANLLRVAAFEPKTAAFEPRNYWSALSMLWYCLNNEVVFKQTGTFRADSRPVIFFFTDGEPTDDGEWKPFARMLEQRELGVGFFIAGCGEDEIMNLKIVGDNVCRIEDASPQHMVNFLDYIKVSEESELKGDLEM